MLPSVLRRWSRCCSYTVLLCGLDHGEASRLVLPCSSAPCFFSPFSIVIISLGEEGVLVNLVVYFNLCPFSLSLGVEAWLRRLTVALAGFFY